LLGAIAGIVAAIAAIYTGGMSLAAGVGIGAVVGTAIGSMSFYHGMQPGDTKTEVMQKDSLMVLR
jgi:flagellar motor component MotA